MNTTEIKKTTMTEDEKEVIKAAEILLPMYEENIERMFKRIGLMLKNKERNEVIDSYYELIKSQVLQYIQLQDDYYSILNK